MMYFPDTTVIAPADAGLPEAREHRVQTKDGETIVVWYAAPKSGKFLILYFHGNGGHVAGRAARFRQLSQGGHGILAVSYRGYGGSTSSPSEAGLILDAQAAYGFARSAGHAPERIIVFGESLGTGVAIALAAKQKTAGIILEAAYNSTAAVAASVYWMFPVRWLMHDTFRSDQRISAVKGPLLFLHGDADPVIPLRFGKALFERATGEKEFVTIPGGGHQVLEMPGAIERVRNWLDRKTDQ